MKPELCIMVDSILLCIHTFKWGLLEDHDLTPFLFHRPLLCLLNKIYKAVLNRWGGVGGDEFGSFCVESLFQTVWWPMGNDGWNQNPILLNKTRKPKCNSLIDSDLFSTPNSLFLCSVLNWTQEFRTLLTQIIIWMIHFAFLWHTFFSIIQILSPLS